MDLILYTENTKWNLSRSFCTSVCEARVPVSGSFIFSELDIVLPRTRQAFMCLRVRYVFVSRAFLWICCAPRLLTESTAHWSPIKPSSAAGTACKGFALRLPVITHQEIMALCSVSLSLALSPQLLHHLQNVTSMRYISQHGAADNLWHFKHRGTITSSCSSRPLCWVGRRVLECSDNARCRCHMGS